jgi:uncharacterized membrane protein YhaH (DUF805 family)
MNPNMTPVDWAKRPILEKYADFTGRAPRAEFWWYVLALIVAGIVVHIVESILGLSHMIFYAFGPLSLLFRLATIVPSLAVSVRRLHDTNRPGWWVLLPLIPELLMMVAAAMTAGAVVAGGGLGAAVGGGILTVLIGLVALVGAVVLIVFCAMPSQPGSNQYGPNPYGEGGTGPVPAE